MLKYYEPVKNGEPALRYVAMSDVHRIEAVVARVPIYKDGTRALIYGRGKNAFVYHSAEDADVLAERMNEK
jgi:hypothetical protein